MGIDNPQIVHYIAERLRIVPSFIKKDYQSLSS